VVLYHRVEIDRVCEALTRLSIDVLLKVITIITMRPDDDSERLEVEPGRPYTVNTSDGRDGSGRLGLFGSLCALVFLVNFARVVFAPLLDVLGTEFALSGGELGLVATLAWVGSAAPRIPVGYLLTKVPRHYVVLLSGTVITVAAVFIASATSVWMLYLGAAGMGMASGVYFVSANPLVSELFPEGVGKALGTHGMAAQFAAVGAPVLVSAVLVLASWRTVFWLAAGAGVFATLAVFVLARRATLPDAGSEDRNMVTAVRAEWAIVLTGLVVAGSTGFLWNGLFNFYVGYLEAAKSIPPATGRNLLTLVFAGGVPAFWVTGRLADRMSYVPLLLVIVGGFAASVVALTLVRGLLAVAVASVVVGYVMHSLYPALDAYLLDSLPDHHRGSAYAVYGFSMIIAQSTGSVVLGSLTAGGIGFDTVFRVLAAGLVVVVAVLGSLHLAGRLPAGPKGTDPEVV
jgi:MFS family permease